MRYHEVTEAPEGGTPPRRPIKKLPPELRRVKINFAKEQSWFLRLAWRLRDDSQFQRTLVQSSFLLLCLWIGVEFHLFVRWGLSGGSLPARVRPPGVEGFLPISALISLKYYLQTGIINRIHPSGLFILLAALSVSLLLKKAFCSYLCPIGTLSESLWMLGRKLFGRNLTLPRWLDLVLRSLKYLLLFFFLYSIWMMDVPTLLAFIRSPYNKMADVKMYLFFRQITGAALWIILSLALLSVVIRNFWCRYLCPYGALLGIVSWLSPLKITRNASTCIDCELCTRACPANIPVHRASRVRSDECMSCMACVEACPVERTLDVRITRKGAPLPIWAMGLLVAGLFAAITALAMLTGHWQNGISRGEYLRRFHELDSPLYQHFQGKVPPYGPND
jgi:polyferredoxin